MTLLVVLVVLALVIGGIGLFVAALKWMLILAAVFFLAAIIAGWLAKDTASS